MIPPSSRRGRLIVARKRLRRRMTGKGRLIAAQAVIVAVLIGIVYATFLQGDDGGTLTGIDAPTGERAQRLDGGDRARNENGAGEHKRKDRDRRGDSKRRGEREGAARRRRRGAAGSTLASGFDISGPFGSASEKPPGSAPAGDQYQDTVTALKQRLGMGDPSSP